MIKKTLVFILLFCLSITFVITLYVYSNRNTDVKNGFERVFSGDKVRLKRKLILGMDSYSIIDITPDLIRLYKFRMPYDLVKIPIDLHKRQDYQLPFLSDKEKFEGINTVAFTQGSSFVLSGKTSKAYKLHNSKNTIESSKLDNLPFYNSEVMNANSFVFISKVKLDGINRRKVKKVNWQGKELNSYIPEKQIDGYFCTDGQFTHDNRSNRLVYMYYYRGSFTCLDTNLNVVYQSKTIDTVKYVNIRLKQVKNKVTHSTPPNLVNKRVCVTNDRVYMQSALKADNETSSDFEDSEVIDVYNLENGKYINSFYIPRLEKKKLTEFKIYNNTLVVLYNHILAIFEIPDF